MKKRILDELGNSIDTIAYDSKMYPLKYRKPAIVYDYSEPDADKDASIKRVSGLKHIEKLGYVLCSCMAPREWGWKKKMLTLIKNGSVDERFAKKQEKIYGGTYVEFDEANLRIRLISDKASPSGRGEWIRL